MQLPTHSSEKDPRVHSPHCRAHLLEQLPPRQRRTVFGAVAMVDEILLRLVNLAIDWLQHVAQNVGKRQPLVAQVPQHGGGRGLPRPHLAS